MSKIKVNQIDDNNKEDLTLPLLGSRGNSGSTHRRNITTIDQDSNNPYNLSQLSKQMPNLPGTMTLN